MFTYVSSKTPYINEILIFYSKNDKKNLQKRVIIKLSIIGNGFTIRWLQILLKETRVREEHASLATQSRRTEH